MRAVCSSSALDVFRPRGIRGSWATERTEPWEPHVISLLRRHRVLRPERALGSRRERYAVIAGLRPGNDRVPQATESRARSCRTSARVPQTRDPGARAPEGGVMAANFIDFVSTLVYGNLGAGVDRKSTRLNSSHVKISYA